MKCFEKCHTRRVRIPRGMGLVKEERGFSLIETVIAIALLGIVAVSVLSGLGTASKALFVADERATAESLARSQMEYVKNQAYDDTNNPPQYFQFSSIPDGYTIAVTTARLDPNGDGTTNDDGIQKITIAVAHLGKDVVTVEGYKLDR